MCYNIPMKLIVGLGNPGLEYHFTRHNFGFLVLDYYAKVHDFDFTFDKEDHVFLAKIGGHLFVKPQDYYNNSGRVVYGLTRYYCIAPEDILIICDDLSLPFGTLRYRQKGSAGGNRGLDSVLYFLDTPKVPRLRLGTANSELMPRLRDVDFVLSRFTFEERSALQGILASASLEIDKFIAGRS